MFPGDLFQQPTTPVQNAVKIATNPTINRAITDLPMSETQQKSNDNNAVQQSQIQFV